MKSRDYHNEIDPYAAQWTRNLMKKGLIPDGFVDERDVRDVQPMDLWGFTRCHFFSGIAGWACALRLAGVSDDFPLWTGSCPCQPFSVAGQQKGFADERHLWPIWAKLIAQSRPAIVLGEQVAGAAAWLRLVRSDLEAMGYAVGAIPVEAASAGAYHLRDRFWFVAYSESEQARAAGQPRQSGDVGDAVFAGLERYSWHGANGGQPRRHDAAKNGPATEAGGGNLASPPGARPFPTTLASVHRREEGVGSRHVDVERLGWVFGADGKARRVKPGIRLLAYGIPNRASKLRAYGNAIDLRPAAAFIEAALACRP